jgi:hypothetical protein
VVAVGNFVYVKGVTAAPVGDITEQTRQVLQVIDLLRGNQDEGRASIWMRKCRRMRDGGRA